MNQLDNTAADSLAQETFMTANNMRPCIKTKRQLLLYKVRFCNSESRRRDLFSKLQEYNDKLEKLLSNSERYAQLNQQRRAKQAGVVESTICSIWLDASKLFKALASVWNCSCREQHTAKLLLQHPHRVTFEATVIFATLASSSWDIYRTSIKNKPAENKEPSEADKVSRSDNMSGLVQQCDTPDASKKSRLPVLRPPNFKAVLPTKSSFRSKKRPKLDDRVKMQLVRFSSSGPSKNLTDIPDHPPLTTLCIPSRQSSDSCWGYVALEDCCYHIYPTSHCHVKQPNYVSLDTILRGGVQHYLSRRDRYNLALTLASSFLQLVETPWLTTSWTTRDIVFYTDGNHATITSLEEPHLRGDFFRTLNAEVVNSESDRMIVAQYLNLLGVVLLELCFGKTIDEQRYRQVMGAGNNEAERRAFNNQAAQQWQYDVDEEAGHDYSEAVKWCLGKNVSDQWRQDMLQHVIEPLQRSRNYLTLPDRIS